MKARTKLYVTLIIGAILIIIGSFCLTVFQTVGKNIFNRELQLYEGTTAFRIWSDYPFPIKINFYFFNCTNADAVISDGHIPNLSEIGPYVFDVTWRKQNFTESEDGCTLAYRSVRNWHFRNDLSNGTLDDRIVAPDIVLTGIAYALYHVNKHTIPDTIFIKYIINRILDAVKQQCVDIELYSTVTVGQLLFTGFYSCILKVIVENINNHTDVHLPSFIPTDGYLSLLGNHNGSESKESVVHTGRCNLKKRALVVSYDGENTVDYWNGTNCAIINGTDAELWIPETTPEDDVTFYIGILRRQFHLKYDSTVRIKDVKSYKFNFPYDNFANSSTNPDNKCYEKEETFPNGVFKFPGLPVLLSLPHYLGGDPVLYSGVVNGISPIAELHSSTYAIEPHSGVPVQATIALQGNLMMAEGHGIFNIIPYLKRNYSHPLFWLQLNGTLPDSYLEKVILFTETSVVILNSIGGCLISIGSILVIWAIICYRLS